MEKEQKTNFVEIYSDWDASRVDMAQSILRSKGIESVVSDIPAKVSFGKRLNMHIMVAPSQYTPSVSNLISGTYLFQKVGLKGVFVILLIMVFLILFALLCLI